MFKSFAVFVTTATFTAPVQLFTLSGTAQSPIPVDVYNSGIHTVFVGGSTSTECLRPIVKGASMQFGVIGGSSLWAKLTPTATNTGILIVTIGP